MCSGSVLGPQLCCTDGLGIRVLGARCSSPHIDIPTRVLGASHHAQTSPLGGPDEDPKSTVAPARVTQDFFTWELDGAQLPASRTCESNACETLS